MRKKKAESQHKTENIKLSEPKKVQVVHPQNVSTDLSGTEIHKQSKINTEKIVGQQMVRIKNLKSQIIQSELEASKLRDQQHSQSVVQAKTTAEQKLTKIIENLKQTFMGKFDEEISQKEVVSPQKKQVQPAPKEKVPEAL